MPLLAMVLPLSLRIGGSMSEQRSTVGISNRKPPEEETRERHEHPPTTKDEVEARADEQSAAGDGQGSSKTGVKASAQKNASTRHPEDTAPASAKVEGAFGKESKED